MGNTWETKETSSDKWKNLFIPQMSSSIYHVPVMGDSSEQTKVLLPWGEMRLCKWMAW